jgi:hypothetical protein
VSLAALIVAIIAVLIAAGSYYATWRFKRADVKRENAVRAAQLVDEAEQLAARPDRYGAEADGGATVISRLLQAARIRAQPLDDLGLDDRFRAALSFVGDMQLSREEPGRARHWLGEAIANVRAALVPHLAAPTLFRRRQPPARSFPTFDELNAMEFNDRDGNVRIDALIDWRAGRE